ncbi:ribbon-helix-helix protein, CopG family [Aquincola sp. S2]|uniref:Ribbon-helix-helix protein, CopG family n=1 Tax=Pseudaquabacterium terrae TaxID=2732868 RepID=A0ABX2ELX8_9BURK|nr:ribbon-helix-helix protein, CopG family [Aquabacterium terrae]NRF69519.1 ribbon-helix-helix protein, CopG family [Aquabacterium terrae]
MRVNARLDEETQQQLEYLVEATGESVSHVVRESVARYYRDVRAERGGMRHFAKMIGKGNSGRSDIASNYKQYVAESIDAKYGLGKK